jgi:hypothetical protein
MTHRKSPGSIEEAIDVIVTRLGGAETTARMIGASRSTVDSWKNPGRTAYPSVEQVITLDAAYANNTGVAHPTPIIAAMLLAVEKRRRDPYVVKLVDEVLKGRLLMEELAATLLAHVRNDKLGQSAEFSADEKARLQKAIGEAVQTLVRLSGAIEDTTNGREEQRLSIRYSAAPLPKQR